MMRPMRFDPIAPVPIAAVLGLLLSACQGLGPGSVGRGRAAYNDVIAQTSSEQTLGLLVRIRYGDPIGLLSVSSVTASLKFGVRAGGEVGIGAKSGYAGNLVPFSGGIAYEDSPTISYVPVDAQAFLAEWLKPLPLDTVILSARVAGRGSALFALLVDRVNGLRSGGDASPAERAAFTRAIALLDELLAVGVASWIPPAGPGRAYELVFSGYAPAHVAQVDELLALLGAQASTRAGAEIRIPVVPRTGREAAAALAFETRSVGAIMRGAAEEIEVPAEHVEAGVVAPSRASGDHDMLRIRSSVDAPSHPSVAVEHRGFWYYVDDTDLESKHIFQEIQILFLSTLAQATAGSQSSPILTVPVK